MDKEQIKSLAEDGYEQVCIWPGTLVVNEPDDGNVPESWAKLTEEEKVAHFESAMKDDFGVRVKYLEEVKTNPDIDTSGFNVPGTGGRNDLFFLVHNEDIPKFAIPRLKVGIRWWEDMVSYNSHAHLYPREILDKYEVRW